MNVPGAWSTTTGKDVTVAVLDTGYTAHFDLDANRVAGYDFVTSTTRSRDGNGRDSEAKDEGDWTTRDGECTGDTINERKRNSSWHGTHVAGTVAAVANNSKGVAGVAYGAKYQPVRVLGYCGGDNSDIAEAIIWASGGTVSGVPANPTPAKVINLSLGGGGSCGTTTQNAVDSAVGRGATVVVAVGNDNTNASGFTPANCNNVITVAASDRQGNRASYSNYGDIIDLAAPGGETYPTASNGVLSTLNSGTTTPGAETYAHYQGTSMATPHIAGLAALMYAAKPSITPATVESTLKANVRALPGSCSGGCGAGLADATKTVNALGGGTTPPANYFANTDNIDIPDAGAAVTSSINVTDISGNAPSTLKVGVDIKHTFRGDLVIDLIAPDGTAYRLKGQSDTDSADNVSATYTVNASSETANGTWKLRVQDVLSQDTGYIDAWNLTF